MNHDLRVETWRLLAWTKNKRGTYWLNLEGFNLAVFENPKGSDKWVWGIKRVEDSDAKRQWGQSAYSTPEGAKLAVLKVLAKRVSLST